jgi:hypothetical protein
MATNILSLLYIVTCTLWLASEATREVTQETTNGCFVGIRSKKRSSL